LQEPKKRAEADPAPGVIGSDMNFTEEQLAFRESIRRMVEKHVAPIAAEIDETDRFPEELLPIFGDMGLMQLWVPEQYGGPNGNLTLMCMAREEISRVSPACGSLAGLNTMFIMPLLHFGSEEQRKRFLPLIARGGVPTAIAISEPQAGSDVSAMTTRAVKDGDAYVFMDPENFDQVHVSADILGDLAVYLQENMEVTLSLHNGVPISIELPTRVVLEISETEPVVKGQTASGSYKPAKMSNGIRVMVPPHIGTGTRIIVNTEDGAYVERAKD